MIYLNKILPVFFSPLFVVLALLILGLMTRRRIWLVAGVCLLFAVSLPIVSDSLQWVRQNKLERLEPSDVPSSEAIVVLGQGMSWVKTKNGVLPDWGDPDRFFGGVELILANKAPKIVFTAGKLPWDISDESEGDVLKRYAQMMQVPTSKIWLTEIVENTAQEARAVRKILGPATKRIILVTSASHMHRAQWLFEQMGFEVFAYPVDLRSQTVDIKWDSFLPSPWALTTVHTLTRELLGSFYYQLTHLISHPAASNE